ncbi:hypothetical protein FSARC_9428 [Fusarium sarcochroum]|uniref:Helicase n=1 Tax=Fusarium sarcochroum TaxID=1208366 RepID=A0A8H4TR09_9HYPO|nr:hypothetical protein FSARC_9428 [Fusarium sarcochroum]
MYRKAVAESIATESLGKGPIARLFVLEEFLLMLEEHYIPSFIANQIFFFQEMGLGKTLCVLSLICWSLDSLSCSQTQMHSPASSTTLIVVPKSMTSGWENQIKRHVIIPGQTRVALYHGTGRQRLATHFRNNDIILTTYQTLRSEWINKGPLFTEQWFRVVLDEAPAHRIGNRSTQVFQAACELQSPRRWCLTGTPIVNSLDNYGALLSFIQMEPFVDKTRFDYWISSPIREKVPDGLRKLRILVGATCLRRTKSSITQGLPCPTIRLEKVDLLPRDRALYDFFEAEAAMNAAGLVDNQSYIPSKVRNDKRNILSLINNLRRICNHGENLLPTSDIEAWRLDQSSQTSWQRMHTTQETYTPSPNVKPSAKIQRQKSLSRFTDDPSCTIMLATIGSGGEGIDLTSANDVHLMEPHWNPMAEEQAIARVHRIGQLRHVAATKYITPHSIEEYVQSIQDEKLQLIQNTWGFDGDYSCDTDSTSYVESDRHELGVKLRLTVFRDSRDSSN